MDQAIKDFIESIPLPHSWKFWSECEAPISANWCCIFMSSNSNRTIWLSEKVDGLLLTGHGDSARLFRFSDPEFVTSISLFIYVTLSKITEYVEKPQI